MGLIRFCTQFLYSFLMLNLLTPSGVFAADMIPSSLTAAQAAQWSRNQFHDPKAYIIEVESPEEVDYTHSLDLRVMVFKNAGWNDLQIVADHFQRVSEIYSRCKIKLGEVSVVVADAGTIFVSEDSSDDVARRTPAYFEKPIIYFASLVSPRYHAYAWSGAEACSDSAAKCNTAWISSFVNTQRYKSLRDPKYNVVAHELAHIIGDYDHTQGLQGNILGEYPEGGSKITAEQCRKFKTFPGMTEL